jgi:hypothetical protein
LMVDAFKALAWSEPDAFRLAMSVLGLCCLGAYMWFVHRSPRRYA